MPDAPVAVVAAPWAFAAAALLLLLTVLAAATDGVLGTRPGGGAVVSGLVRPLTETARLLRQRRRTLVSADKVLWRIGGAGLLIVAFLMVSVVPLGEWTIFDLDVGVMWFNAMDALVWAVVWLTGWGANSTYSLIGGYRFLAQALAYELPLMFAIIAPAAAASSLNVATVAAQQHSLWFAVWMPVAFLVYCLGVVAFSVWGPFGPALGSDLAGGASAELSSVDRLLFLGGRYAVLSAGAAFAVPVFLGGGAGPLLPPAAWVLLKAAVLVIGFVSLRRKLPAVRPDRFMEVGWVVILPAVLLQDFVVAVIAAMRR